MTRLAAIGGLAVVALLCVGASARAFDKEAAIEKCRASTGKPTYHACRERGGSHEACFAKSRGAVSACVGAARPTAKLFDAKPVDSTPQPEIAIEDKALPLVAPPRTVSDITAILDREKPDPERVAKLVASADAEPDKKLAKADLAEFHYKRAQARSLLGRNADALADAELAITYGQGEDYAEVVSRYENLAIRRLRDVGNTARATALLNKQLQAFSNKTKGRLFGLNLTSVIMSLATGDVNRAEAAVERNRALLNEARRWPVYPIYGMMWQGLIEDGNARIAEARGRYADAEKAFHRAAIFYGNAQKTASQWASPPAEGEIDRSIDWATALEGRVKVKQGRVGEGEADVRRALLSRLGKSGKFHFDTAGVLGVLVYVLQEQGRYKEAENLQHQVIEIYKGLGYADDSGSVVRAQVFMAQLLSLQRRHDDAARLYDQIDGWTAKWPAAQRETVSGGLSRVSVLLSQGNAANALEIAQRSFARERDRSGDKSFNTAVARGFYATALARSGNGKEALAAFKEAIPVLLTPSGAVGDDDGGAAAAAREGRVRFVLEAYLRLVSTAPAIAPPDVAAETFGYADVLRGQSVQRALQASSARATIANPELAKLVRASQDGEKRLGAAIANLNNLLAVPSAERDQKALREAQAEVAHLQAAQAKAAQEIAKKFPEYASLVNPPPPPPADIQKQLADDEAFLSLYFGRFDSFAWVVRKGAPVEFTRLKMTLGDLNTMVTRLREALEPQAAMISDIPPFDVQLAGELYDRILKPVEATWKPAKSLIVVTNGALGLLPLSLLPTAPAPAKSGDDPLFASYRDVPWLARTHAVTLVPSASALLTLRKLPPGKPSRENLIGFGDPYFSSAQAEEASKDLAPIQVAAAANLTRGVPLKRRNSPQLDGADSAQLAMLPRLPDTSDELKSIALALQADPSKVLNLGKDASEAKVKTADLSGFKIIAFATHGLVPGELDGLTQPALALSAPSVAGSDGDGLLTMEEILSLKLDADWVVLSACNTGAGAGAGAEAASGLGRAFFYAGTRALLVTNWSVHSQSARELVTDLFRRQAQDPKLTRGEALRQAMMALADGPGYVADGKTEFAYAHPLFWAPYTIIGDGGR